MEIGVYHEFHCRPDQDAAAAFEEALGQIEAADRWGLDAIWRAVLGKPRAFSRNARDCQTGVDATDLLIRGQILQLQQRLGGAETLSATVSAHPRRRRQRGDLSVPW